MDLPIGTKCIWTPGEESDYFSRNWSQYINKHCKTDSLVTYDFNSDMARLRSYVSICFEDGFSLTVFTGSLTVLTDSFNQESEVNLLYV